MTFPSNHESGSVQSQKGFACMLFKRLRASVVDLECLDLAMPRYIHHAQHISSSLQRRRDEAGAKAVTREERWIEADGLNVSLQDVGD